MAEPALVAACVDAMKRTIAIPVTVKCRIGIDDQDPEAALDALARSVMAAGADALIVHARKAWLNGLSPKENRDIPPLDYNRVYRLKASLPRADSWTSRSTLITPIRGTATGAVEPWASEAAEKVSGAILDLCISHGGAITGEHGVGVDKKASMTKMFSEADLDAFQRLRCAFDPAQMANPGKVMPAPRLCGEVPGPYRQHPIEAAGVASRL